MNIQVFIVYLYILTMLPIFMVNKIFCEAGKY